MMRRQAARAQIGGISRRGAGGRDAAGFQQELIGLIRN